MSLLLIIVVAAGVVCTLVGAVVALRGLRPPRSGDTPYCRRCGYNLTGRNLLADTARCSECGAKVTAYRGVVLGERHIRPRRVIAGVSLLLLGGIPLGLAAYGSLAGIDWYRFKPTFWLVSDLHGPDALRACTELERRRVAGRLSAGQMRSWADAGLSEQARVPAPAALQAIIDSLGGLCVAGQLSAAQRERFFAQMLQQPTLEVRARVVAGDPVPFKLKHEARVPSPMGFMLCTRTGGIDVDGWRVSDGGSECCRTGGSSGGACGSSFACNEPGRHELRSTWLVGVYLPGNPPEKRAPDWRRELTFSAEYEVLDKGAPDPVRHTRAAPLDLWATQHIRLSDLRCGPAQADGKRWCDLTVTGDAGAPVDFAFDVLAQSGNTRTRIGSVAFLLGNGAQCGCGVSGVLPGGVDPKSVVILLMSSAAVARGTTDMYEIWGGDLRLGPLRGESGPDGSWYTTADVPAELFEEATTQSSEAD